MLLILPAALGAQQRDTLLADTTTTRYELKGFSVLVPRASSTTGGSSAVELRLDSAPHIPAPTMEQVLREMPLIQIRQNSRGEAQPAMRGAEDRQIAILVDGVPLTLGWDHRTDLSIIPLTAAQSIKLIRGLSSVLHGPNVLGGVVEVDVARGSERQAAPEPLVVDASVDHVGGRALSATGGQLLRAGGGEWVVRGGVGYQERPGVPLPGGLTSEEGQTPRFVTSDGDLRLNSDVRRYDGFLSARYRGEGGAWMSFAGSAYTSERGVPPEAHLQEPRLWRYPGDDRFVGAFTAGTGQRGTAWGEGDLEVSVGLDLGTTEIEEYADADYDEVTGGEVSDDRTVTLRLLGDHSLGRAGELRGAFTFADVDHDEILGGTELNRYSQRLWSLGTEAEFNLGSLPGIGGTRGTRLSLGVAVDGADTPESGGKPALERLWDWGGRLGLSSLVEDDLLVHGAVSRRARFPALRELYSGALGRFIPNPDLRPEILTGGELGFTLQAGDGELQLVGFHQRLTDGIVRVSVTDDDGTRRYKRVNQDEVRSTGLEMLASAGLGPLSVSGDLTLQRVRGYTEEGEEMRLEYEPTLTGKAGVGATLPLDVLARADVRYRSEQYCQNPEVGGLDPFDTDPSVDVSFRRAFRLGDGGVGTFQSVETAVTVGNVGDAAVFDQCGLPQAGRTLRMQVRLR